MTTDPFLRLNEILNHMIGIIKEYQNEKEVPVKTLDLMEQEIFEAKKITTVLEHENRELKEVKAKIDWIEKEVQILKQSFGKNGN